MMDTHERRGQTKSSEQVAMEPSEPLACTWLLGGPAEFVAQPGGGSKELSDGHLRGSGRQQGGVARHRNELNVRAVWLATGQLAHKQQRAPTACEGPISRAC